MTAGDYSCLTTPASALSITPSSCCHTQSIMHTRGHISCERDKDSQFMMNHNGSRWIKQSASRISCVSPPCGRCHISAANEDSARAAFELKRAEGSQNQLSFTLTEGSETTTNMSANTPQGSAEHASVKARLQDDGNVLWDGTRDTSHVITATKTGLAQN